MGGASVKVKAVLVAVALLGAASVAGSKRGGHTPANIHRTIRDEYCDQPIFATFLPKTEENQLLDNVCYTYFPLPDDPNTFQIYQSRVYCDGSTDITSFVATDMELGVFRAANPFCTFNEVNFGYAGCDTYLVHRNAVFGDCGLKPEPYTVGMSPQCRPIGLSCLRKVEEIISDNCLPETEFFVLPMKLPNRCVTQQLCLINNDNDFGDVIVDEGVGFDGRGLNPLRNNLFYKTLGLAGPINKLLSYPARLNSAQTIVF